MLIVERNLWVRSLEQVMTKIAGTPPTSVVFLDPAIWPILGPVPGGHVLVSFQGPFSMTWSGVVWDTLPWNTPPHVQSIGTWLVRFLSLPYLSLLSTYAEAPLVIVIREFPEISPLENHPLNEWKHGPAATFFAPPARVFDPGPRCSFTIPIVIYFKPRASCTLVNQAGFVSPLPQDATIVHELFHATLYAIWLQKAMSEAYAECRYRLVIKDQGSEAGFFAEAIKSRFDAELPIAALEHDVTQLENLYRLERKIKLRPDYYHAEALCTDTPRDLWTPDDALRWFSPGGWPEFPPPPQPTVMASQDSLTRQECSPYGGQTGFARLAGHDLADPFQSRQQHGTGQPSGPAWSAPGYQVQSSAAGSDCSCGPTISQIPTSPGLQRP